MLKHIYYICRCQYALIGVSFFIAQKSELTNFPNRYLNEYISYFGAIAKLAFNQS